MRQDDRRETHLSDDGLWIPPEFRAFEAQLVFRTPRATIQHFGSSSLDPYYGMIDESHFGDADEFSDPKNLDLAPDRVRIKPQGEDVVEFVVDLETELVTDGGDAHSTSDTVRKENRHGVKKTYVKTDIGTAVVETPKRIENPVTERTEDLTNLSRDGYCRRFLALLSASNSPDVVDFGSTPVATFDKNRWELREQDGQYLLVKHEAESAFGEILLDDKERTLNTGTDRDGGQP